MLRVDSVTYSIRKRNILRGCSLTLHPGEWLAILGQNGSGKTTLIDTIMDFKVPSSGVVTQTIPPTERAYLSEKVDLPGDWSVKNFLEFNRYFYPNYSLERESELIELFQINVKDRVSNLSAGQIRRAQLVGALSYFPKLIIIDEITAVMDVNGRRKLEGLLQGEKERGASILFATNILEGLVKRIDRVLMMKSGELFESNEVNAALLSRDEGRLIDTTSRFMEHT